eukprot:6545475-Alexandrium_andersonii.AAC.1
MLPGPPEQLSGSSTEARSLQAPKDPTLAGDGCRSAAAPGVAHTWKGGWLTEAGGSLAGPR